MPSGKRMQHVIGITGKVATQMKDLRGLTFDERLVAMSVIGSSEPLSVIGWMKMENFVWHKCL